MKKILFIDNPHPSMEKELSKMGFLVDKKNISYPELLNIASDYYGYIIRSKFIIDKQLIDKSINLKFIARIGAGMENIDTDYAKTKNIICLNSPEGNADAVSEFVIGSLFNLLRYIKKSDNEVRHGIWDRQSNCGLELHTKTVGIIGYGNMGSRLADKLKALGCKVLVYDKFKKNFGNQYIQEVTLKEIQKEADIVSIHINYTDENHYYINKKWINGFRKNIYLVNTSRGKVLHTAELIETLKEGKVIAAALDVLEYENIRLQNKPMEEWDESMHFLAQSPNVLLSPHIAGQTYDAHEKHVKILVEKIKKII
jgi:D-3-phosphoglycerate dehydrogenase